MKTAVVYYSLTGNTRKIAQEIAQRENAALYEIVPERNVSLAAAYLRGGLAALRGKSWAIKALAVDSGCVRVMLCSPVWAGNLPPFVNAAIGSLPRGAYVELICVSASGKNSAEEKVRQRVAATGCRLVSLTDVKSG